MARVEWTRQSGEDVEAVVATMLCTQYPNAHRVQPSQGDGGYPCCQDVMDASADITAGRSRIYAGAWVLVRLFRLRCWWCRRR